MIKKIGLVLALLIPFSQFSSARTGLQSTVQIRTAFAFEQLTVSTVSKVFTAATYNPTVTNSPSRLTRAELAVFSCEDNAGTAPDNAIRYRDDGTAPTTSVGVIVRPFDVIAVNGYNNILNFKMIRDGAVDVVCDVHYFRASSNAN